MRRFGLVLGLASWLAACAPGEGPPVPDGPVEWFVAAALDTPEVEVGDDFRLTLTVTHPPGADFVAPAQTDFEPLAVLETSREDVSPVETKLHYRLAAYRLPEELEMAPLVVRYRDEAGEMARLETEALTVRIVTSLTPNVTDIHDIKDPIALEIPRNWSLLWWLLLALLAALAAYLIYRRYQRHRPGDDTSIFVPPPPPPDVEAEAALARLAAKELVEKGEMALFYTELTDIVKRYAGRRFEVSYLERTTYELLSDLRAKDAPERHLRAILETADLVKFAKGAPDPEAARSAFSMAHELLRETRPRRVEPVAHETPAEATA